MAKAFLMVISPFWSAFKNDVQYSTLSDARLQRRNRSRHVTDREAIVEAYHRKIAAHQRVTGESYPRITTSSVTPNGTIYSDSAWKPQLIATWQQLLNGKYHIELM
jgi:hypothetical protein